MSKYFLIFVLILVCCNNCSANSQTGILWSGGRDTRKVALTFDDGPKHKYTNLILDILKELSVKATFFVVGKECGMNPDLVYRIYAENHELGNHTYSHYRLDTLSREKIETEILSTSEIIKSITGREVTCFRPPGGKYNKYVLKVLNKHKIKMIMWDVNANDYVHSSPFYGIGGENPAKKVYDRIVSGVRNGSIILMHNGGNESIKALPDIIRKLRSDGYEFITLSEMMP
ncbi:MAG: polysaccharide deacetylase family protein [bacterium]|nr:polysaccharide deacetylase family protein [bacterium]